MQAHQATASTENLPTIEALFGTAAGAKFGCGRKLEMQEIVRNEEKGRFYRSVELTAACDAMACFI
jgi:hypothetical protein